MLQERRGSRPGTPSNNRTPSTGTRPLGVRQFHSSKIDDKPLYVCAFIKPNLYFQEYIRIVLLIDYSISIHCIEPIHSSINSDAVQLRNGLYSILFMPQTFPSPFKSRLGDYFKSKLLYL